MPTEDSQPLDKPSQETDDSSSELPEKPLDAQPARRVPEQRSLTAFAAFSGPLPPPDMLKTYNEVEPGLAREIIEWAKAEAQHRRDEDERESKAATEIAVKEADAAVEDMRRSYTEARIGQFFGFVLGGSAMGGAVYLGVHDAQTTACILVGTGIASIIIAFLKGRNSSEAPGMETKPLKKDGTDKA